MTNQVNGTVEKELPDEKAKLLRLARRLVGGEVLKGSDAAFLNSHRGTLQGLCIVYALLEDGEIEQAEPGVLDLIVGYKDR